MTTRRGFLVLGVGGGAAALLSACGEDTPEPGPELDTQLLSDALVAEENANSALAEAARVASGADRATLRELSRQASANAERLHDALADRETTAEGEFTPPAGGGLDAVVEAAVEQTNAAIQAYRVGAGQLTTEELRKQAIELAVADGARLALLYGLIDEDEAPFAFVTGTAQPHESIETSPTTTTTTTTTGGDQ